MVLRRSERISVSDGVVSSYIHNAEAPGLGKIGIIVGLESGGDKAKLDEFGRKLAMHIAAANPLAVTQEDAFYVALGQWMWVDTVQSLVVRTEGDAEAFVDPIRQAIASVDSVPPLARIATMDDLVDASESQRQFVLTVFLIFSVAALVLAGLGLYGVIAVSVAERNREIGVRTALGAAPEMIRSLVLRQGLRLAAIGIALGLIGALAASNGLESLLFGVAALDPITYLGVIALLIGVCAMASLIPARRAASVDPTTALRSE